jgi:hypothetical protein
MAETAHQEPMAAEPIEAASFIPSAGIMPMPDSRSTRRPLFYVGAFLPSNDRNGYAEVFGRSNYPFATISQRTMPPKMLIKTAYVLWRAGSECLFDSFCEARRRHQEFAGSPPASLMISIVAIAAGTVDYAPILPVAVVESV